MKAIRSTIRPFWITATACALGLAALAAAGSARAGDVYWSIGVAQPGVSLGFSNAPPVYAPAYAQPVYVQPAPVYVQPAPVYVQPRPVYAPPAPVYYRPQVAYVPAPVYRADWAPPGHVKHWHKKHNRHQHPGYDRWDDGRRDDYRR